MSKYFGDIFGGFYSLLVGLGITIKAFFQPVVTFQYPRESLKMTPRYRGHIELVPDPESGEPLCIVCGMCQKNCPTGCITVAGAKPEGGKKKVLTEYRLNFTTCSLCGICVENCKPNAITFSKDYNLASTRKQDFYFDLLKRLKEKNG